MNTLPNRSSIKPSNGTTVITAVQTVPTGAIQTGIVSAASASAPRPTANTASKHHSGNPATVDCSAAVSATCKSSAQTGGPECIK